MSPIRRDRSPVLQVALAAAALASVACSGAQMVLRDPIENRCKDAGLRGCEDLADGILLYVEGQKPLGYDKVKQGVAVNMDEPAKIKTLVVGLKLLQQAPGVGPYVAQVRPIVDMMDAAADEALKKSASRSRSAKSDDDDDEPRPKKVARGRSEKSDGEKKPPPEVVVAGGAASTGLLRTGTVMVGGNKKAESCTALAQTPAGAVGDAQCVRAFLGPIVVTDLHAPGGCGNELVIGAGDPQLPRWFVVIPSGMSTSIHGGALVVPEEEGLWLAARGGKMRSDAACSVTWAGVKK
jgi:hypothetical protein